MSNKGTEIVPNPEEAQAVSLFDSVLPAITNADIIAVAEEAEKRLDALIKIKRVALKATNPNDWVDESGKPYLQSSGAEKVARIFGISWRISEPTVETLDGGHYIFSYTGEFALWGSVITAVGTRSSKDPFFKKYKYVGKEEERERIELPISEIDRADVKKAAYSNLLTNGITRLLGIRNLTWEDLEKYAGIKKDQVQSVEYKKGGKAPSQGRKPSPQEGKPTMSDPDAPATNDQGIAILAILNKQGVKDEFAKMEKVAKILGLKEVPVSVSKLTKGQASTVIAALQKEAEGGEG